MFTWRNLGASARKGDSRRTNGSVRRASQVNFSENLCRADLIALAAFSTTAAVNLGSTWQPFTRGDTRTWAISIGGENVPLGENR